MQILCAIVCLPLRVFVCQAQPEKGDEAEKEEEVCKKQPAVSMVTVLFHRFVAFRRYFLSLNQTMQQLCC